MNECKVEVIRVPERLDLARVPAFQREMELVLAEDKPQIVLDCSSVGQIDSAGVESLLRLTEQAMHQDGDLKLAAVSPAAAVILQLTRIDRVFEIFNTVPEAIASFSKFPAPAMEAVAIPWTAASTGLENAEFDLAS
jgi:anti-anti-sigma factor